MLFGSKKLSDAPARNRRAAHETNAATSKDHGDDPLNRHAQRRAESRWREPAGPRGAGLNHTPPAPPIVGAWLAHLAVERGLSGNSIDAYRRDLADVAAFLQPRGVELAGATGDDYAAYLREQSRLGRSTATVTRRLATIRAFLNFRFLLGGLAAARQIAAALARLERPKPHDHLPTVLTRTEVARLVACPGRRSWLFPRDLAALELLYATGIRASELCGLDVDDVIAGGASRSLRVFGKGSIERLVFYGRAAAEALAWYLAACRPTIDRGVCGRLFLSHTGRPLQRRRLYTIVCRYALAGGLPRIGPHVLRHCFASHLLGGGADLRVIQELLGHASVTTTQRYVRVDYVRLKAIHRRYHPRP